MAKKKKLVTKAEFARKTGVSKARISQLVKKGTLKTERNGKLDFNRSIERIRAYRDPSKAGKIISDEEGEEVGQGFRRARTAREIYTAKLTELKYKTNTGALINAMELRSKLFESYRILKDALENLPDRVAAIFAGETDSQKIHSQLKKEIDRMVQDFKKGVSKLVTLE